ncbi:hypothetical protein M422DRAFT_239638 [Sphaerobolus stellatus SS14]|nr:hypothetical protein M422DRAFT_239638 [Sphaerobolus stellatus SS14]
MVTSPHLHTTSPLPLPLPNSITEYIPILPTYQVGDSVYHNFLNKPPLLTISPDTPPYLVRSSPSNASASAPTILIGHLVVLHILLYQIAGNLISTSVPTVLFELLPPTFVTIHDEDNAALHALTEHRVVSNV